MKFRAMLIPISGDKAEQAHGVSLLALEEWAAWRLSANPSVAVQIFMTKEVLIGTISPESICKFCGHAAKSHLGTNAGKTECTEVKSCGCEGFRCGLGATIP